MRNDRQVEGDMIWNEKNIARLQKLWKEGNTSRQVAEALGQGCTRNAVIGKLYRLRRAAQKTKRKGRAVTARKRKNPMTKGAKKTARKGAGGKSAKKTKTARRKKRDGAKNSSTQQEDISVEQFFEEEDGISLFGGGCKWPIGHPDEEDFHFCGKPRHVGFPYCEEHARQASQPTDRRRGGGSTRG